MYHDHLGREIEDLEGDTMREDALEAAKEDFQRTAEEVAQRIADTIPEWDIQHHLRVLYNRRPVSDLDGCGITYWMAILKLALEIQSKM